MTGDAIDGTLCSNSGVVYQSDRLLNISCWQSACTKSQCIHVENGAIFLFLSTSEIALRWDRCSCQYACWNPLRFDHPRSDFVNTKLALTWSNSDKEQIIFIRPFEKRTYYAVAMSVGLSICPSVRPSVRPRFPDFSSTCFEISIWNLVYTFSRWHDISSLSCITLGHFDLVYSQK